MANTYYKAGSWNVVCAVCGRKYKSDEVRKRWDGLIVCSSDYETRHILDFLRVREENSTVPYVAPEPADVFIAVIYPENRQARADLGAADGAPADVALPI